ncbi:MAG: hypothetical protein KC593_17680 [Myxococcales bacterium]|nr:hypothetical protein [Myxococcales bacterium]
MTQSARARLDAILDLGLEHAPATELAWLAAERARDAAFDAEVRALLEVQERVAAWGEHMGAAAASLGSVEGALAGIFDGLDAGLYDDGLTLDAAPQFQDEDEAVVGLGARPATAAAAAAPAAAAVAAPAAPAAAPRAEGRLLRLVRDNRAAQVLAAAAAVTVVVTAGLSAVRLSAPNADESATGSAASPAVAVSAAPAEPQAAAPMAQAPSPTAAPVSPDAPLLDGLELRQQAAEDQEAHAELHAEADDAVPLQEGARAIGGEAHGQLGAMGGAPPGQPAPIVAAAPPVARAAAPTSTSSSVGTARPSGSAADTVAFEDSYYARGRSAPSSPRSATGGSSGASAPAEAVAPAPPAPVAPEPAPRYRTWAALRPALEACLQAGHEVRVEVQRGTGAVRVIAAPSASAAELRCVRDAASASAIAPPPTVTRQLVATRRPSAAVSDTPSQ